MSTLFSPEQFASAQKAQIDGLLTFAHTAFAGMERLAALNLNTARSLLEDSAGSAQALMNAKDIPSFLAIQGSLLQPSIDKALLWSRDASDIGTATRAELDKTLENTLDELVKHAPVGTEAATSASVGAIKSAIGAASTAYETLSKAAKQASDYAESNLAPAAKSAPKARKAA